MESPFPMVITKAKDGTYIEANKTAMNSEGWQRKQIIGHQSTELGVISPEQRNKFTHEIKKAGTHLRIFRLKPGSKIKAFFTYPLIYFR